MVFIDYWKGLVLNFSDMENTVFFEGKSWWKGDTCWLLKSVCFKLFGDCKYAAFLSQKVDRKTSSDIYVRLYRYVTKWNKMPFIGNVLKKNPYLEVISTTT